MEKGWLAILLTAPLLLGATASDQPSSKKDVTVQHEAAKTTSNTPRVLIPTARPPASASDPAVVGVPTPAAVSSTATNSIGWYSINGGGLTNASSTNYAMGNSVGQSGTGQASSPNYRMGIGFWYGARGGCSCPHQGDLAENGFIDVSDVLRVISIAFVNGADTQDPECPKTRADVNNSAIVDVQDVLYIIKTAFTNGPPPVDPCGP
jgi:hypothetical protein